MKDGRKKGASLIAEPFLHNVFRNVRNTEHLAGDETRITGATAYTNYSSLIKHGAINRVNISSLGYLVPKTLRYLCQ